MKKHDNVEYKMDNKQFYENTIRELNKQLYDAYKRIAELNHQLIEEREQNGKN
tara:strand:+ start:1077 stop:1235 length:159 start_codon:yes stop_codon:yes gene_type:complete